MMKLSDKLLVNICKKRKERNITQADMAEKLGLSETGYAKVERGETKLDFDRLHRIANILEINIAELIPFGDSSIVVYNNPDFNLSLDNEELEHIIVSLKHKLFAKDETIRSLRQHISTLEQIVKDLSSKP